MSSINAFAAGFVLPMALQATRERETGWALALWLMFVVNVVCWVLP